MNLEIFTRRNVSATVAFGFWECNPKMFPGGTCIVFGRNSFSHFWWFWDLQTTSIPGAEILFFVADGMGRPALRVAWISGENRRVKMPNRCFWMVNTCSNSEFHHSRSLYKLFSLFCSSLDPNFVGSAINLFDLIPSTHCDLEFYSFVSLGSLSLWPCQSHSMQTPCWSSVFLRTLRWASAQQLWMIQWK